MEASSAYVAPYLLITPLRDEIGLLHALVATVRAQEHRPALWLLLDDGSTDGTSQALDALADREPWVHVVHLPVRSEPRWGSSRYAEILGLGFQTAAELAEAEGIAHRYVANLDADVRSPPHLIAELITRAEGDRMVGIASCDVVAAGDDGSGATPGRLACGSPRGGLRVWRRDCLEEIAFYPVPHWASVTGLRARNRGWKTVVYEDLQAELVRPDGTREGWWSGYQKMGEAEWHVGMHPAVLAAEAVRVSARERDLRGLALVAGYVQSALMRRRQCRDPEILAYYGSDLPREQLSSLLDRIPASLRARLRRGARPP